MRATDFDFHLPESFIALEPVLPRDSCNLLVLRREIETLDHLKFRDLPELLSKGDLLLLNDTRVFPARLAGTKKTGGRLELLLVKELEPGIWEVLSKGRYTGRIRISNELFGEITDGKLFRFDTSKEAVADEIWKLGLMPLPPYIKRRPFEADKEWYQTVYAEKTGSIASPTAGLHFTEELIEKIRKKGVLVHSLTLHVGIGTFKPVTADTVEDHRMDREHFEIGNELIEAIKKVKGSGKRIVTVGTTTTRAIEAVFSGAFTKHNDLSRMSFPQAKRVGNPSSGERFRTSRNDNLGDDFEVILQQEKICGSTDIFIRPGYEFKVVDSLVTNFHLPRSTPLMLASALCGRKKLMKAYREAVSREYRFFSYGDAMMIL